MKVLLYAALGLFLFAYRHLDHVTRQDPIPWRIPFIEEMSSALVIGLAAPLVMRLARRTPPRWGTAWIHVPAAIGFSALLTTGFYVTRLAAFAALGMGRYDYGILWIRYFMELPMQLIVYAIICGVTIFWDHRERTALLELENLRLQLQPHFLFNTLNMISSVVYEDPKKADEMLCQLSEYLRDALARHPAQEVTLADEIATTRAYLAILEARFENGLGVEWEIEEGVGRAAAPHFLLQPLVENAVKHGLRAIRARREGAALVIAVEDEGADAAMGSGLGIGLGNTRQRLERLYGAGGRVALEPRTGCGTVVRVTIPYRVAA